MANKHLQLNPHHIKSDPDVWWYEDNYGIDVHMEFRNRGHKRVKIPWRSIKAALKRKEKPEEKK